MSTATPVRYSDSIRLGGISALLLFLELALIRWLPAHVLFLTFFTNTVLLASFLGMSVGCLLARKKHDYIRSTPLALAVLTAAAYAMNQWKDTVAEVVNVGSQVNPQQVFFGTEYHAFDVRQFGVPIELVGAVFFLLAACAMLGPGQELGRALDRIPDRVRAYTFNIAGSLAGIVLFAACSWRELPPIWWFAAAEIALAYFLMRSAGRGWKLAVLALPMVVTLGFVLPTSSSLSGQEHFWSPYYRVDYAPRARAISVNLIGHQEMVARSTAEGFMVAPAYSIPHLMRRDSGGPEFSDVLIIGAGSGNDVARALQWGAKHIDAVEIDPVIQRLGSQHHPDHPYQDSRVTVHLDDGRNFLRSTDRKYDLVVYALVDSLVLHSSYSNIRLESYLFTTEAFSDVKRHLKPGGMFVMYNFFRQGWIVSRLQQSLTQVFGGQPVIFTMPYQEQIDPGAAAGGFTIFMAGDTQPLRNAFAQHPDYWLSREQSTLASPPDGFEQKPDGKVPFLRFRPASVVPQTLKLATDEWPFLYVHEPMIPSLSLRGMALMGGLAAVFLLAFLPRGENGGARAIDWRMFFLGAGFMLIETKAVVEMALLFGSTWMVNTFVFFAVLVMILAANLFVLKWKPSRLWPYYAALLVVLAAQVLVPLNSFLGLTRAQRIVASCTLVFAPILFAGIVFAVSFSRSDRPDRDFGTNIAGAMLGGLSENASMLLGFKYLVLVAAAFYAISAITGRKAGSSAPVMNARTAGLAE